MGEATTPQPVISRVSWSSQLTHAILKMLGHIQIHQYGIGCLLALTTLVCTNIPIHADVIGDELLFVDLPSVHEESKYRQKTSASPGLVSVVTAEEIQRFGHRTLIDILDSVPGFYASDDRTYSTIGVRGFGDPEYFSQRFLLMIDGIRTNDGGLVDSASVSRHFLLDISMIERIEISRGPGSSLYGANAITAVVNVMTKRGRDIQGVETSLSMGSNNAFDTTVSVGKRNDNGVEYLLSFNDYRSDGAARIYFPEFDYEYLNNGIAENVDGETDRNLRLKASYKNLSMQAAVSERSKVIPTGAYHAEFNAPENQAVDNQYLLRFQFDQFINNDVEWQSIVYAQRQEQNTYSLYDISGFSEEQDFEGGNEEDAAVEIRSEIFKDDGSSFGFEDGNESSDFDLNVYHTNAEWYGLHTKFTVTRFYKHRLVFGIDGRYNDEQKFRDASSDYVFFEKEFSSWNWGIFAQNQYLLRDNLQLFLGIRYDYFKGSVKEATPRLGLVYQPNSKWSIKILYSTAFRAPNTFEFYTPSEDFDVPNKNPVDGERIETYEILFEHHFNERWVGFVNLFSFELSDIISYAYDEDTFEAITINIPGSSITRGIDFAIDGNIHSTIKLSAGVTYQKSEGNFGEELVNSPSTIVKLGMLTSVIERRLLAGLDVRYISDRLNLVGGKLDGYTLTNLTFRLPALINKLDVDLSVYNLFDKRYSHTDNFSVFHSEIPQDGRQWRFKLGYRF